MVISNIIVKIAVCCWRMKLKTGVRKNKTETSQEMSAKSRFEEISSHGDVQCSKLSTDEWHEADESVLQKSLLSHVDVDTAVPASTLDKMVKFLLDH